MFYDYSLEFGFIWLISVTENIVRERACAKEEVPRYIQVHTTCSDTLRSLSTYAVTRERFV